MRCGAVAIRETRNAIELLGMNILFCWSNKQSSDNGNDTMAHCQCRVLHFAFDVQLKANSIITAGFVLSSAVH